MKIDPFWAPETEQGAPVPASPSTDNISVPPDDFFSQEVEALIRMAPDQDSNGAAPPEPAVGNPPVPQSQDPTPAASAPVQPPGEATQQPPAAPAAGALTSEQLVELARTIKDVAAPPPPPAQPSGPGFYIPDYQYNINDQLLSAITSEDTNERRQAVGAFATVLSRTVHEQAVRSALMQVANVIPSFVEAVVHNMTEQQRVASDFYGRHKELARPELRALVVEVGRQVQERTKAQHYTPELGDLIAQEVKAVLRAAVPQATVMQPAPTMAAPTARPLGGQPTAGMDFLDALGAR